MATYYKWAERQADTTINWAEVGKNLSDTLKEEVAIRELKKAAIDEKTRQLSDTLESFPMGDFEPANQMALDFANSAQETLLIQDNLLKSGLLKPRDYTIMRQNLNDGTKTMFDLSKVYQEEFQRKQERAKSLNPAERSQYMESWMMEQMEGLGNLRQTKAVINPTDGQVTLGKLVEKEINGETVLVLSDKETDTYTVNELNMRIKQDFNYYDADAAMQNEVEMIGDVTNTVYKTAGQGKQNMIFEFADKKGGVYLTDEEIAALPEEEREMAIAKNSYKEAERYAIEKQMAQPWNSMSVLTDDLNKDFEPTFSKEEADSDPSKVYIKQLSSGALEPELSEEQEELVYDYLKNNMRKRITTSEAAKSSGFTPYSPERQAAATAKYSKGGREETEKLAAVGLWNKILYAPDSTARNSAIQSVVESAAAKANGVIGIDFDSGASENKVYFTVKDADGNVSIIKKDYNVNDMTLESHAELGSIIHGITDSNKLNKEISKAGKSKTLKYESGVSLTGAKTLERKSPRAEVVKKYKEEVETATGQDLKDLGLELGLTLQNEEETNDQVLIDSEGVVVARPGRSTTMLTDNDIKQAIKVQVTKEKNQKILQSNRPAETSGTGAAAHGGNDRN